VAREWRRLLIEPARLAAATEGLVALEAEESHYLRRVLRLRPGDRFALIDGRGRLWSALLHGADQARLEQPQAQPLVCRPAPAPPLELVVAPPKRDTDVLVRMACELGIDRLTLVQAERRVAPPLAAARAQAIVREACEQSERLWLPQLVLDPPLDQALNPRAESATVDACPGQPLPVLSLLATPRSPDLPSLLQALGQAGAVAAAGVRLAIGPEGGWTPAEQERALGWGWRPVSLGETILRSSTAAVAAASLMAAWREGISCAADRHPSP